MFNIRILFLFASAIALCNCAFVDILSKCSINDEVCMKNLFKKGVTTVATSGAPDLDIPQVDPFRLQNVTVPTLNLVNITLVDGVAKGITDCVFNSLTMDIGNYYSTLNVTCDIMIKGRYKQTAASPLIPQILGGSTIEGDGRAKVKLSKLNVKFHFNFTVERDSNGEIYIKCKPEHMVYDYKILDKVTFALEGLYLNKQDISKPVENLLNQNWRLLFTVVGRTFMDKAMEYVYLYAHDRFFDVVPARYYILEDMSPYVK